MRSVGNSSVFNAAVSPELAQSNRFARVKAPLFRKQFKERIVDIKIGAAEFHFADKSSVSESAEVLHRCYPRYAEITFKKFDLCVG